MNHRKLFIVSNTEKKTKNQNYPVKIDRVDPEIKRYTPTPTHTQGAQKCRKSSKSGGRKISPLPSFLFEKAKTISQGVNLYFRRFP